MCVSVASVRTMTTDAAQNENVCLTSGISTGGLQHRFEEEFKISGELRFFTDFQEFPTLAKYHAGQNDYRPSFFISTSNSCKNDRDPAKDP